MTPQEKDLIAALLSRLQQAANRPKDAEAEALIRQGMAAQPDAPYLLVQTVLIQDMGLSEAQRRIEALERELAAAKGASSAPASFLGDTRPVASQAGPWKSPTPAPASPALSPASRPVWTQSAASLPPQPAMAPPYVAAPMASPWGLPGASSGFLQQAVATAAGVAGGALLFQGIQSMFGPHYYGSMLGGMPMQPGINETVINNYYGDSNSYGDSGYDPGSGAATSDPGYSSDAGFDNDPGGVISADDDVSADAGSDFGGDFGSDDGGSFDV
jgi:hypothetical protein